MVSPSLQCLVLTFAHLFRPLPLLESFLSYFLRNLWNFSPKHFFTDPSGMYWRERRLRPGLYTDGVSVYESSYRYEDGRNGMHRVSAFQQFLGSKSIKSEQKEKILKRLQHDAPDIVLEL